MLWEREQEEFLRFKKNTLHTASGKSLGSPWHSIRLPQAAESFFWIASQILIPNPDPAACHFESPCSSGRCCCKEKWFIQVPAAWEDSELLSQRSLSMNWGFYREGERKRNKETWWQGCGHAAVSLLNLIRIFNISTSERSELAHAWIRRSVYAKVLWSMLFLVQTEIAGAYSMLIRVLVYKSFI